MATAQHQVTDFTVDDPATIKAKLDGNSAVAMRNLAAYQCYAATPPDMTVKVAAGSRFLAAALVENAIQTTAAFAAPVGNPRIDRIVIDAVTGVHSVVAGTPAASPAAPAIPAGKEPCAQILLQTNSVAITNSMITDERAAVNAAAGTGQLKFPATQNASADANTLDDYEEGTFTPGVNYIVDPFIGTYGSREGVYTKIGRLVTANFLLTLATKTQGNGLTQVTGLPFAAAANVGPFLMEWDFNGGAFVNVYGFIVINTSVDLYGLTAGSVISRLANYVAGTNGGTGNFEAGSKVRGTVTYQV